MSSHTMQACHLTQWEWTLKEYYKAVFSHLVVYNYSHPCLLTQLSFIHLLFSVLQQDTKGFKYLTNINRKYDILSMYKMLDKNAKLYFMGIFIWNALHTFLYVVHIKKHVILIYITIKNEMKNP